MELCIEHAREKHNRSVDRVADLIGVANKFTLYKWIESGKLPAISIRPFEHACGCDLVTRYLAHSAHKLMIDIPTGARVDAEGVHRLSEACNAAVGELIRFYKDDATADEAVAKITAAMEVLAWHRGNALKFAQPELGLDP